MTKNRLHAFTLIELTIALLLVALLSGIAYSVFSTFHGHTQQRQWQKQERYSLDLLIHRLKIDCAQADSISGSDQSIYFTDSLGQVEYTFGEQFVLRQQYRLRTDTFHIGSDTPQLEYIQKKKVRTGLVQQIDLNLYFKDRTLPIHLQKNYSSEQILEALNPH